MARRLPPSWLTGLTLPLLAWGLVVLISLLPQWQRVEGLEFDLHSVLAAPGTSGLPITVVGIDEPSFADLDRRWPWPRRWHARLIDELGAAGASLIVFDVVFAEPSTPEEDAALADAIRRSGRVVLAGDYEVQRRAQYNQAMLIAPLASLREAGARWGSASIRLDPDLVVRRMPEDGSALWRAVAAAYAEQRGLAPPPVAEEPRLVRHLGPDHSFPYFSYYQALDAARMLPADSFRDRIVFVGLDLRTTPEPGRGQSDSFASPFSALTGRNTPGVEIEATFVANFLRGDSLRPAGRGWVLALAALVVLGVWSGVRRFRLLPGLLVLGALLAGVGLLTHGLFLRADLWLSGAPAMLAGVLGYLLQGGVELVQEHHARRRIRRAFERYVAPTVVAELIAHPEQLALGGSRRPLTLVFTDLAGFTSLAEGMEPERVGELLNYHLTAVARIVLEHRGTVDKFIGDALMAFWGAPLDDPEHALNACRAALAMQREMENQRAELRRAGMPELRMRIGIHTGTALVGNLGSEERFAYTAVGDDVNLASRLEGVNKLYGTSILLSESTAETVAEHIPLSPVDRIRVKGRVQPVAIFTPCEDSGLCGRTADAIAAYRRRDWDLAEAAWTALASTELRGVANVYLERIAAFRANPPVADWDGSVALEKQ